jgi:hypothetical protein
MIEQARHVPLRAAPWSASDAVAAIEEIVADGLEHFNAERFWPAHPLDGIRDGHASLYFGATGMIWGIDYLGRVGATKARFDFRPVLPRLLEANREELPAYEDYAAHGSLLLGDLGATLLVMRLDPTPAIADLVYERAAANTTLPVRELMWGTPGSMIACLHGGQALSRLSGQSSTDRPSADRPSPPEIWTLQRCNPSRPLSAVAWPRSSARLAGLEKTLSPGYFPDRRRPSPGLRRAWRRMPGTRRPPPTRSAASTA